MATKNTLKRKDEFRALDLIRSVGAPIEGTEFWQYFPDWDDQRVATEIGFPLAVASVRNIRLDGGLKMPPASFSAEDAGTLAAIGALRDQLDALTERLENGAEHDIQLLARSINKLAKFAQLPSAEIILPPEAQTDG